MKFLINCSNLKIGGGIQVADSFCTQLDRFPQHQFVVVVSSNLSSTKEKLSDLQHVEVYSYNMPSNLMTIISGRDRFMDNLVSRHCVDAVLTVFGPSRWCPKVPHLSGFAMAQLVILESPFYTRMTIRERVKWFWWRKIRQYSFKQSAGFFWTENPFITKRLENLFGNREVFTVTNYYNQVFDTPDAWQRTIFLPEFTGTTCLSVSNFYPHKNFEIIIGIVRWLKANHPDFLVRFVLTFDNQEMPVPEDVREAFVFIGKVDFRECPSLYAQCDIMFMPTLIECFTATYPEAMRMEKPIVTTDLQFARGLCGEAACYYNAVDFVSAAEAIYKVATNTDYARQLVENGKVQLTHFDNYKQRADKLVKILERISK